MSIRTVRLFYAKEPHQKQTTGDAKVRSAWPWRNGTALGKVGATDRGLLFRDLRCRSRYIYDRSEYAGDGVIEIRVQHYEVASESRAYTVVASETLKLLVGMASHHRRRISEWVPTKHQQ
ncbi:MAG: hypothetical protein M1813_002970 [Trichoglossum hirsutum]|nr:MAG: hypothetical protein M1813_002970 [Trichoglossum hirsutum]